MNARRFRHTAGTRTGAAHKGRSSQKGDGYGSNRSREGPHTSSSEDGRPSEDDVAQERLGWRGQKGRPRPAMMTEEGKLQTSPDLDPGHTS